MPGHVPPNWEMTGFRIPIICSRGPDKAVRTAHSVLPEELQFARNRGAAAGSRSPSPCVKTIHDPGESRCAT